MTIIGTLKGQRTTDPFIGPRPFQRSDQKLFYGRDSETDEIVSLIFAHALVLVYAQSGVGKTSIFNAKILPVLEEHGFEILPTARVKMTSNYSDGSSFEDSEASQLKFGSIQMLNAMLSMMPSLDPNLLATESLKQFLDRYFPVKEDTRGKRIPQILIFDQFEELFSIPTKAYRKQQGAFFQQIVDALDRNPVLRIAFLMREEYLGPLGSFTDSLPDRLRYRFRLERLTREDAFLAVRRPIQEISLYEKELEKDIHDIISNLEDSGQFVEPIHLQVVCRRWWQRRSSTKHDIQARNLEEDFADVDKALEEFYTNAVQEASRQTGISEKAIRTWCANQLITPSETRGIAYQSEDLTAGMSNKVIEILSKEYLIRPELRSGGVFYELTHDRMIKPIMNSYREMIDREWKKKMGRMKIAIPPLVVTIIAVATIISFYPTLFPPVEELDTLGPGPIDIEANPITHKVYSINSGNNTVSVIELNEDSFKIKAIHNIQMNQTIGLLSVDKVSNRAYVVAAQSGKYNMFVIDGSENKVMGNPIPIPSIPFSIYVTDNKAYLGYSNYIDSGVSVFDVEDVDNPRSLKNISINREPNQIYFDQKNNKIYVSGEKYHLDNFVPTAVNITDESNDISYNLSRLRSFGVSIIPGNNVTNVRDIELNGHVASDKMSVDSDSKMIYFTNSSGSALSVMDETTGNVTSIELDEDPFGLTVDPKNDNLYVLTSDGSVSIVNATAKEEIANINVDENLIDLSIDPDRKTLYVADFDSNMIYPIDVESKTKELAISGPEPNMINLEEKPIDIAVNEETDEIYILDSGTVSVIDGEKEDKGVMDQIKVDDNSKLITLNPRMNIIAVADTNWEEDSEFTISLINGTTGAQTAEIPIDTLPMSIAFNNKTNTLKVGGANFSPGNVTYKLHVIKVVDEKTYDKTDVILPMEPNYIAADSKRNLDYILGNGDKIHVMNGTTNSEIAVINVMGAKRGDEIAINTNTNMLYVSNSGNNTISVINGTSRNVTHDISIGNLIPADVDVNSNANRVFVTVKDYGVNFESDRLIVIDGKTEKVVGGEPIRLNGTSGALAVNQITNETLVLTTYPYGVSVLVAN